MAVRRLFLLISLSFAATASAAETVRVAVAANFAAPLKELQPLFERQSGHTLSISSASTGTFYAQIRNGAPFDVFLAADRQRPERLIDDGMAEASSALIYARGRLLLWSPDPALVDEDGTVLATGDFAHLALANPRTAPYGAAAMQVLQHLGLDESLSGRLVQGENIAQTWQFVASNNAELGFVALSQPIAANRLSDGSHWLVPQKLYDPIEQMAVVLSPARRSAPAQALMEFLQSDTAVQKIRQMGYGAGPADAEAADSPAAR